MSKVKLTSKEELIESIERIKDTKAILKSKEPNEVISKKLKKLGVKLYCPPL